MEERGFAVKRDVEEMARRCFEDPLFWASRLSGEGFDPWSGQVELWEAYRRVLHAKVKRYAGVGLSAEEGELARKHGISVMAGQGLGKERTIALIGLHYLSMLQRYQPKVVCTAPAGPTLHSTLWPEFGKVIEGSEAFKTMFEKQSNRIYLKEDGRRGEYMRIEPRTIQPNSSAEEQGVVLAGIHATGVLYLVTEASGVPEGVFRPIEGGMTDPLSLAILIFNPTRRTGFAAETQQAYRRDWVCLHWSGRTLKAEKLAAAGRFRWFNEQAQDVLIRKYGEDSDFVRIRVDGLPPVQSADTLIPFETVVDATERVVEELPGDPLVAGVDVGGGGEDDTVLLVLRGPKVVLMETCRKEDPSRIGDWVAERMGGLLETLPSGAQWAVAVDSIGIGRGVYSHLRDVQQMRHVYAVDVSERPLDERRFHRLRDQVWWETREAFLERRTPVIPADEELMGELTSIRWTESGGKIKVEGKPEMKRRGVRSPNKGDAFCLAWYAYQHRVSRLDATRRPLRTWRERRAAISWKAM